MSLVLLLLLSAALIKGSEATSSGDSAGNKHIVAFPENIAYFHPSIPRNLIYITALSDSTSVTINSPVLPATDKTLAKGVTEVFSYDGNVELKKSEISERSFQITSSQYVTVHAVSIKNTSMQTALIIPNDKLGRKYFIPPVPAIHGTNDNAIVSVTERQPFKLIIVNTDQENKVTVEAQPAQNVSLKPHQVAHVFITNSTYRAVTAEHPVAVIFGHTCAIRQNCTCSLLYATLPPAKDQRLKFYIPTVVTKDAEAETYILLSDEGSTKKEKFNSKLPLVETAGTAILFRPGLLLSLIPETDFAACYLIYALPDVDSFAVIVVHKDDAQGVHIGKSALVNSEWEPLTSTDYVSTKVALKVQGQNVIWHSYSTMAVYLEGNKKDTLFGNPASVISKSPDYRGCVLSPEEIKIGDAGSWPESVEYCRGQNMELISFPTVDLQKHVYTKINQDEDPDLLEVWIGMRRRSLNGELYWLSGEPVDQTNWAEGEPGTVDEGQCAVMSVESSKKFGWKDEDCCVNVRPLCYKPPVLFPMNGA